MTRVLLLAVSAALLVSCSKPEPPPAAPPAAPLVATPDLGSKRRIPNIDQLSVEQLKPYYAECTAFKDMGDPRVPYVVEDCRRVRARWDRRNWSKPSTATPAKNLPNLH